jgi:hypothetical protein
MMCPYQSAWEAISCADFFMPAAPQAFTFFFLQADLLL